MIKLVLRLIGFAVFFCASSSVVVFLLLAGLGWIDVQRMFPGLPDPPTLNTGDIPGDPFGEFSIPSGLQPGDSIPLKGQVQPRPLFEEVPVPQQISTNPTVVGSNLFLAILVTVILGVTSTVLNNMLRDEEARIQNWLRAFGISKLADWIKGLFSWTLGRGVRRGCLTLPLVLLIFALYGVIFAFLEEGTSILSREGLFLAGTLAISVGMVSSAGDTARRFLSRLWREKSSFNLYPVNLLVAAGTVAVSRLVNLSQGIVFGTPGGADVEEARDPREQQRRDVQLGLMTIAILAGLGGVAWTVTGLIVASLDTTLEYRVAQIAAAVLTIATNLGLAIFLAALQTSFYELLPFAYNSGGPIFRWNKFVWGIVFMPIAFFFIHTLLNPQYGLLDSVVEADIRFLWFTLFALVSVTAALWIYFNLIDDVLQDIVGIRRKPRPAPQPYVPPQQGYYDPNQQGYDDYDNQGNPRR